MIDIDTLLVEIAPLAKTDRDAAAESAPEFQALSFFESHEPISTKILSYLLNPYGPHGQNFLFLEEFLNALEIDLGRKKPKFAFVQPNAPCYTQTHPKFMDILILFSAGEQEYAVVVESKSHGANDQMNQVRDYLQHIRKEYPGKHKFLFYLSDGEPPSCESIPREEWEKAHNEGICNARNYRAVMNSWFRESRLKCPSPKLKLFLDDFKAFSGREGKPMKNQSSAEIRIKEIMQKRADESEEWNSQESNKFDALLTIYDLHDRIWEYAVRLFMDHIRKNLMGQLPEWDVAVPDYDFKNGNSSAELGLFPPGTDPGNPLIGAYLATEWDESRKSRARIDFVLYIKKGDNMPFPPNMEFNSLGQMRLELKKGERADFVKLIQSPLGDLHLRTR
jgi:PD-(D/E)XK nuclease superfamily